MNGRDAQILTQVCQYMKDNRKFFRSLFFYNRLTHSFICRTLRILSGAWVVIYIAIFLLVLIFEPDLPDFIEKIMEFIVTNWQIFLAALIISPIMKSFRAKLDVLTAQDYVDEYTYTMNDALEISDVYWKRSRLKKMLKLISSGKASSIQDAACKLRLRHTKPRLTRYYKDRDNAIERYNKVVEKANALAEKRRKSEQRALFWGSILLEWLMAENNVSTGSLYSSSGDSGSDYSYRRVQVDNDSKAKERAENARKSAEFAEKSDYWRSEYYKLKDSGVTGYRLNDAEYNMNYFARLSREWDR